jgi:putative FmdB family regulatory protein
VPIYEYLCEGCAYKFEVKQSIKDDPIAACDRCGKPVKRLISSPAIMFKGSGWYVTDYSDKLKPPSGGEPAATPAADKKEPAPASATTSSTAATTPPSTGTPTAAPPSTSNAASTSSTTTPTK